MEGELYGVFGAPPLDLAEPATGARQFSPLLPGSLALEEVPPGRLAGLVMSAVPGTLERRRDLALMLRALAPGAPFTVLAPKDMGGGRLRNELAGFGCTVEDTARRHHRICTGVRPETLGNVEEAVDAGAPRRLADLGLWSQPGIFSWDRLDTGTALLLDALPVLSGTGADFGCGIGTLAHGVLASPKVAALHLVDLDRRAIEAARRNVDDARASFHWADVRAGLAFGDLDFVVSNPPFHDAGTEDKHLGASFIERAAAALRRGGQFWMVANRHLPYETLLAKLFRRVTPVGEAQGFKIMSAQR